MSEIVPQRKLLTRRQAAEFLGLQSSTLARWASEGYPPLRYFRLGSKGGRVVYDQVDLDEYPNPTESCG